jgi:hypothetical protein
VIDPSVTTAAATTTSALPTTTTVVLPGLTTPRSTASSPTSSTTAAPTTTTTAAALRDRDQIAIVVANGTFVEGRATKVSSDLKTLGYAEAKPANAIAKAETTTVYAADGFDAEAIRLAQDLGLGGDRVKRLPADRLTDASPADLTVVLGTDFKSERSA